MLTRLNTTMKRRMMQRSKIPNLRHRFMNKKNI
jgi:hypothetical protein